MAALAAAEPTLAAAGLRTVVVSFGTRQGAAHWLRDTGCRFPLLLDPDRRLYTALGLGRSLAKVWGLGTVQYYAGQVAAGRPLPAAAAGEEDDPLQMGGDFTLSARSGRLLLVHPSSYPRDRPSLQAILGQATT